MANENNKPENAEVNKVNVSAMKTILQQGVDFAITVKNPTLFHRLKLLKSVKVFVIHPILLGPLMIISEIINSIKPVDLSDKDELFLEGIECVIKYKDKIEEIIAIAIMNKKISSVFDRWRKRSIIKFIDSNLSADDVLKLFGLVIAQLDVTDFLASIVSVKGISLTGTKKEKAS